jgi:uncharacterized membrane protein
MDNNSTPLIINVFALIFSSMPEINGLLQTLVLILSIAVSIVHLYKSTKK